jgi:hypothetical protein
VLVQSKPTKTASPAPAAPATDAPTAKPATPRQYVVQVGSKQNQTDALATFVDMQQKYPTLLANYRPMVQKVDLSPQVSLAHRPHGRPLAFVTPRQLSRASHLDAPQAL